MANTKVQLEVEAWIRDTYLKARFGQSFAKKKVRLPTGGQYECDAVNHDESILVAVCTSGKTTSSGRQAAGSIRKVKGDIDYLAVIPAKSRLVILTDPEMCDYWRKQAKAGRVSDTVQFEFVDLPPLLKAKLFASRFRASREQKRP